MKPTRFLWMLMVALLVPAMALSGCDKKKHVNRDDDDDSSSGSKEKSEQVDEDTDNDKEIDSDDLIGKYELDPELMKEVINNNPAEEFDNAELSYMLEIKKNKKLKISFAFFGSDYGEPIQTTMNMGFTVEANGDWKYDKQKRSLTLYNIGKAELTNPELTFDEMTPVLQKVIAQAGGFEAFKSYLFSKMNFSPDDFFDTEEIMELRNIEMTDDGFCCMSKEKNKKVKYKRID